MKVDVVVFDKVSFDFGEPEEDCYVTIHRGLEVDPFIGNKYVCVVLDPQRPPMKYIVPGKEEPQIAGLRGKSRVDETFRIFNNPAETRVYRRKYACVGTHKLRLDVAKRRLVIVGAQRPIGGYGF
jgi:hypothetical protein